MPVTCRLKLQIAAIAAISASFSLADAPKGVVLDANTLSPVQGAVLRWLETGLADTTDDAGAFTFAGSTSAITHPGFVSAHYQVGSGILFTNPAPGPVRIDVFNLAGRSVASWANQNLSAGV